MDATTTDPTWNEGDLDELNERIDSTRDDVREGLDTWRCDCSEEFNVLGICCVCKAKELSARFQAKRIARTTAETVRPPRMARAS